MSSHPTRLDTPLATRRIGEVQQETGVSKEMIHHYLRLGLIPPSGSRARYSDEQVRLLRLVRTLREDHNIPLDTIRRIFEIFAFDPARLEALTLSESLCARMSRLAGSGALISGATLSGEELAAAAGVSAERLDEYVQARLVSPLEQEEGARFSASDAKAIALCEHGLALGMPFDSFRTIASYVRIAFELEYQHVLVPPNSVALDADTFAGDLFVRSEISTAFVQNVLQSQLHAHVASMLEPRARPGWSVDQILYRPSPAFVTRHGLQAHLDEARERFRADASAPERWAVLARQLLHVGRYREAAFFAEEGLERWGHEATLQVACGRAQIACGHHRAGFDQLERPAERDADPTALIFRALARYAQGVTGDKPEGLAREAAAIRASARAAVSRSASAPDEVRVEVAMLGGWLLTALPELLAAFDEGLELLVATYEELQSSAPGRWDTPGLEERHLINTAYLLLDGLERSGRGSRPSPDPEALRSLICRLDPGSEFAERAFLARAANQRGDQP